MYENVCKKGEKTSDCCIEAWFGKVHVVAVIVLKKNLSACSEKINSSLKFGGIWFTLICVTWQTLFSNRFYLCNSSFKIGYLIL